MTTSTTAATATREGHDWKEAGEAWGRRARDWAYLMEDYGRPAFTAAFDHIGIDVRTAVLDVACGSGLAMKEAADRGADVTGLDASESLLEIARARVPDGDIRTGDMFALPFEDDSFDVLTSFNGIWGGCEAALCEVRRVLRPGGLVALSFWGSPRRLDLLGYFLALGATAPPDDSDEIVGLAEIGRPGVAEGMLTVAGLTPTHRSTVRSTLEWPDRDTAWQALSSPGIARPSIEHAGEADVRARVMQALDPYTHPATGVRVTNELVMVLAHA